MSCHSRTQIWAMTSIDSMHWLNGQRIATNIHAKYAAQTVRLCVNNNSIKNKETLDWHITDTSILFISLYDSNTVEINLRDNICFVCIRYLPNTQCRLDISHKKIKMRHFQVIFSIFVAVGVIGVFGATTSNGLQVVSDDELVERMKANEFVIALFCEWFNLECISSFYQLFFL